MDMNNLQLLQASRNGDVQAFSELVKRHQNSVSAITYSITGSIEHSEDLAQETFIIGWQKLATLEKPAALSGWLCSIARNLARSWVRGQAKEKTVSLDGIPEQACQARDDREEELRQQRSETVWAALSDLPETYREPLVLFYRNGQSIREVAAALDLSEDCIKQRLSRGRELLRQEVALLIEDTLEATLPGPAFTAGIITAISTLAITHTATAVGAGGAAAATTGKTLGLVGFVKLFGILAGPVLGFTFGLFGVWSGIYRSPTLRTRRFMLKSSAIWYATICGFLGSYGVAMFLVKESAFNTLGNILSIVLWVVYLGFIVISIIYGNKRWRRIAEEDLGRRPMPETPLEKSSLSLSSIRRMGWITIIVSIIASIGIGFLLCGALALIIGSKIIAYGIIYILFMLLHYAFYRLFRRGLEISRDQAAYNTYPSPIPNALELMLNEVQVSDLSAARKGRFWHDLLWYAFVYFFASSPIWSGYFEQEQYFGGGTVVTFGVLSLLVLSRWFGVPRKRNWALGLGSILNGCFLAINAEIINMRITPVSAPWADHLAAVFYLGGFTIIGALCLLTLWFFKPNSG